jgi:tRNA threonylcarbamoyladenosine biosynthesis protein TsaB
VFILALDTSGSFGSVALLDGDRLLGQIALDAQRRAAQTLAPAIVQLLKDHRCEAQQVRLVAVGIGPGSFTGLRIAVTTAKTFAYAVNAETIGVSTLEAIAAGVPATLLGRSACRVQAVIDAHRRELFGGRFIVELSDDGPRLTRESPDGLISADEWVAALAEGAIVTGPGLARVESRLPARVVVVPPEHREVQAATLGRLAWRDYLAGRRDDLWKLAPIYLRPSYAEEKAAGTKPGPGNAGSKFAPG